MAKKMETPRRAIALGATAMTVTEQIEAVPIVRGFKASVNGLIIEGQPSFAQWEKAGTTLRVIERGIQFAIGDFLNYGEDRYGEDASQVIDAESGWSLKTIAVYRWLAARIAPERRRMDRLGIRHHLMVAALSPSKQEQWLTRAANDGEDDPWTVKRLSDAIESNEDLPVTAYWVLVLATSAADQHVLQAALEAQGRTVKALMRRSKE